MFELLEDVREKSPYTLLEAVSGFLAILLIGFLLGLMVGRHDQSPWHWLHLVPIVLLQVFAVIRLVKHTRIVRNSSRHAN